MLWGVQPSLRYLGGYRGGGQAISWHPTPCPGSQGPCSTLSLSPTLGCSHLSLHFMAMAACSPSLLASICHAGGLVLRDPCHILPPPMGAGCVRAHLVSAHQGGEVCRLRALCLLPELPPWGHRMGMSARGVGQPLEMDSGASVSRLQGNGGSGQDALSAPGHGSPLCWAGKPSQASIPLETSLAWPRPYHKAPAGRVLLQRAQQRCCMPSASLSPVAPSPSTLSGGTGCPAPGEGLPILGITMLGSPVVAASRWRQPSLLSLWDAVQLHLRILYSCLLARSVLLFFLDLLG